MLTLPLINSVLQRWKKHPLFRGIENSNSDVPYVYTLANLTRENVQLYATFVRSKHSTEIYIRMNKLHVISL